MYKCYLKFFLIFIFFIGFFIVADVSRASFEEESGLVDAGEAAYGAVPTLKAGSPFTIITIIIQIVLGFLGIVFFGLMIYGGYIYMMARGNEQEVEKAITIIRNAIIGLIVVVLAYAISLFVISNIGGFADTPTGIDPSGGGVD